MVFTLRLYILAFALSLFSCNSQPDQVSKATAVDPRTSGKKADNSVYYTQKVTFFIETESGDTLQYPKAAFNSIIDRHPEFFDQHTRYPDLLYHCGNDKEEFGSELGQDSYYMLYAHFLKQRNGVEEFSQERRKLIGIYTHINSLFARFENGGTYFGHQQRRIPGYAEYSVSLLPKSKDKISRTYDITKHKALYIQSLRQLIEDQARSDFNATGIENTERTKALHRIVDELDRLITGNFYLRQAQAFHYGHYAYY